MNGVGGAELLSELEPRVLHIDRDDGCTTRNDGCHDGAQADRAAPKDGNGASCIWMERIHHATSAGLNATSEGTQKLYGNITWYFYCVCLVRQGVAREARLAEE
jgi:hypothetical protein